MPVARGSDRDFTHYELLGVAPTATAAEIRHAWLALIKRHHPDVAGNEKVPHAAVELNRAYRCLIDPVQRADYDLGIGVTRAVSLRTVIVHRPPPSPRSRWGVALASLSLAALALSYLVYIHQISPVGRPKAVAAIGKPYRALTETRRSAIVQEAGLNFEWIALQSDVGAAQAYSRQCWTALANDGPEGLLDYCLAFDTVAERTFGSDHSYFGSPAVFGRVAASAGRFAAVEPLAQRIARVTTLLARDRRADQRPRPGGEWFPLPSEKRPPEPETLQTPDRSTR